MICDEGRQARKGERPSRRRRREERGETLGRKNEYDLGATVGASEG